jgi:outer membrane protein OmpA-like peptidoglycan-associated protein
VADGIDQCPNTPIGARVDNVGCPIDSDGDGVPDGLDLCPNTPAGAKVDKDGCPIEISELETIFLDTGLIRLQDINFETNKANILPESYPRLDEVGNILVQWPQLKIEIGGHADARGAADYNQKLSERRANSVLEYLTEKFPKINRNQYTVKGYGESVPLVPNTGPENWAKNRRVEFKVQNTDVLEKEVERRRLLRQDAGGGDPEQ